MRIDEVSHGELGKLRVDALRPTQLTLGMREVDEKREQIKKHKGDDLKAYVAKQVVPIVRGPNEHCYLIDGHHLARAFHEEGIKKIRVTVISDLSTLSESSFWVFLDTRAWCHLYDADGERRGFDAMPKHIGDIADDPYRSLSGELRRAGGYAKDPTPFSEFLWADFLRHRIKKKDLEREFADALVEAMGYAKGDEAKYLPGWCGPNPAV